LTKDTERVVVEIPLKPLGHELALAYEQSHEDYGQQPYDVGQTDSFVSLCKVPDFPAIDQCELMHVRRLLVHATDTDQQESAVAHATPATVSHPDE
jgi:hypothetical protein